MGYFIIIDVGTFTDGVAMDEEDVFIMENLPPRRMILPGS